MPRGLRWVEWVLRKGQKSRQCHRWVAWSEEDQVDIGHSPDLFHGGVQDNDPLKVARELPSVIDEWEAIYENDAPRRLQVSGGYPKSLSKSLWDPIQNQTTTSLSRSAKARKESLIRTDQMRSCPASFLKRSEGWAGLSENSW